MKHTKVRRYGFLPNYRKSLSLDNCVAVIVILLFMGLVLHMLAPSVSQNLRPSKIYSQIAVYFNPDSTKVVLSGHETKPACSHTNQEYVASQNDVICLIHQYAEQYGIETDIALRVAEAESNFKAEAVNYNRNGSNDKGVYQINSIHGLSDECRLDARCNIEWAMQTMQSVGTTPWYSSKHRWYGNE